MNYYTIIAISLSVIFPIIIGFMNFNYLKTNQKWFLALMVYFFLHESLIFYHLQIGYRNLFFNHLYLIITNCLIYLFTLYSFKERMSEAKLRVFHVAFAVAQFSVIAGSIISYDSFNPLGSVFQCVYVLSIAVFLIIQVWEEKGRMFGKPDYWISIGIFYYYGSNIGTFIFFDHLEAGLLKQAWDMHRIFLLLSYLSYSIALWKTRKYFRVSI